MPTCVVAIVLSRCVMAYLTANAPPRLVDHFIDPRAANGDQRKFRGNEEAVEQHQQRDRQDPEHRGQDSHLPTLLLR